MATITQQAAKLATSAKIRYYPEAASQSFKKGEFVYLDSDGKITVCAADPKNIAGMAMQDASTTTDTALAIAIAEPGVMFEMNVTGAVTAVNQVGKKYGLTVSSNKHYVDLTDTTNKRFVVKDLSPKDATGDTYGRVLVEVLDEYLQLSASTS